MAFTEDRELELLRLLERVVSERNAARDKVERVEAVIAQIANLGRAEVDVGEVTRALHSALSSSPSSPDPQNQ
jgi:hypothetical protein